MTFPEHPAARIKAVEDALEQARRDHDAFRDTVRDRIIQAHRNGDICFDGMNDGLRDLGLPEYVVGWKGTVTLTVEVCVTGTNCDDTARQWGKDALELSSQDDDVRIDHVDRYAEDFTEADEEDV